MDVPDLYDVLTEEEAVGNILINFKIIDRLIEPRYYEYSPTLLEALCIHYLLQDCDYEFEI